MSEDKHKEELRRRYMVKAEAIFEAAWAHGEKEGLTLSKNNPERTLQQLDPTRCGGFPFPMANSTIIT